MRHADRTCVANQCTYIFSDPVTSMLPSLHYRVQTAAQVRLWLGASLGRTFLRPRTPEQAMEAGIIAINRLW
jgi:hypothetical protein